jgi:hypothetical protein
MVDDGHPRRPQSAVHEDQGRVVEFVLEQKVGPESGETLVERYGGVVQQRSRISPGGKFDHLNVATMIPQVPDQIAVVEVTS